MILLNEENQVIYSCNSAVIQEKVPAFQVEEPLGISPEKLDAIIDSLHTEQTGQSHIGLQNVNNRLRLLYGSDALLSLESRHGERTKIRFQIPIFP